LRVFPVFFLIGCGFVRGPQIQDASISGTIDRDGELVDFVGYSLPDQGGPPLPLSFGVSHAGEGPIHVQLGMQVDVFNASMPVGASETPVLDLANSSGVDASIGLSYYEQAVDGAEDDYLYRVVYRQGGIVNGTLFADDTNWIDYFQGRLEATVFDAEYGERILNLDIDWEAEEGLSEL